MSTFEEIRNAILDARLTEDELVDLNHLVVGEVKEARRREARRTISQLKEGGKAKVVGRLTGGHYLGRTGDIIKINRTTVTMKFEGEYGTVRIPASVLEVVHG